MSVTPYAGLTKPTVGADDNTWGGLLNGDLDIIDSFLRQITPAGAVLPYAGLAAPTGFFLCNGQAVSRTGYASLFAAIGVTWGAGDGSTTFNVPDLRDRFPIGAQTNAPGSTGGASSFTPTITVAGHALTIGEMPSHSHGVTDPGHTHGLTDAGHSHGVHDPTHTHTITQNLDNNGAFIANHGLGSVSGQIEIATTTSDAASTGVTINAGTTGVSVNGASTGLGVQYSGGGGLHTHDASSNAMPTVPPFAAVNFIIKT
jgi:microcystin-dependent protein